MMKRSTLPGLGVHCSSALVSVTSTALNCTGGAGTAERRVEIGSIQGTRREPILNATNHPGWLMVRLSYVWYRSILYQVRVYYGALPPQGAGRFGGGSEGAVLLRSATCHVSTADSTLMVGGV